MYFEKDTLLENYKAILRKHRPQLELSHFEVDSVEYNLARSLEKYINAIFQELGHSVNVRIFWISSYTINACVTKIENCYCIGIFEGVITSMVYRLETICIDNLIIIDNSFLPKNPIYYHMIDDETDNGVLGNTVFTMTLLFLLMHEMGHILCGHCDKYFNSTSPIFFERDAEDSGYLKQGKEYVADFYGVANSLTMMLASFNQSEEQIINCTALYLMAVSFVIWLFQESSEPFESAKVIGTSHPHPTIRMSYLWDFVLNEIPHALDQFVKNGAFAYPDNKDSTVNRIVEKALELFCELSRECHFNFHLEHIFSKAVKRERSKIRKACYDIQKDYKNYAYVQYH